MPEIVGRLRTPRLPVAPATPQAGEMYYDTTTNKLLWWDGTKWIDSSGGSSATVNAAVAKASTTAGGGSVNLAVGWTGVPLPPMTVEPSDAFTFSANSVTVKDAGWYHVAATLFNGAAATNLFIALSTSATGSDGDIANNGSGGIVYNRVGCDGSVKLAAGGKVYLYGWSNSASPVNAICINFSIERIGGPPGQMEVYQQPAAPATTNPGAIWIDTDDAPPTGNVPPGGTTGQIITKTGSADYAAGWANPAVTGITGQTYTMSGYVADRVMNAGAMTLGEVAAVLATLIDDMKAAGLIKP